MPGKRKTKGSSGARQPKGMSIHIGLNDISHSHYDWDGELEPCENDARDMRTVARARGITDNTLLLTKQAKSKNVTAAIESAAAKLRGGDLFLITYSGHGGQVPDDNGDEPDGDDETWCLYDRELVDDELYTLWGKFEEGVRILVVSDSCHSGSLLKGVVRERIPTKAERAARDNPEGVVKAIPRWAARMTYDRNKALYKGIQKANPKGDRASVGASVLLISACQDNQTALAGYPNSLFTKKLLEVWNDGRFRGGYRSFHRAIANKLSDRRKPNLWKVGAPNPVFERQRPFTV